MQRNGWDRALKVTADGAGLVGHAGAVLPRKACDQAGLTAQLSAALRKAGNSPVLDRGIVLVSMAAAIALGAASMSDIAVLAHLAPVLGDAPSGPTVRRALDLAGTPAMLDKIARARARARAHVWQLIEDTPAGFPWLQIAGKTLTGWVVIDVDATLVTASSDKEGAAATWKRGYDLLTELPDIAAAQEASRPHGRSLSSPEDPDRQAAVAMSPTWSQQKPDIRCSTTCPVSPRCRSLASPVAGLERACSHCDLVRHPDLATRLS